MTPPLSPSGIYRLEELRRAGGESSTATPPDGNGSAGGNGHGGSAPHGRGDSSHGHGTSGHGGSRSRQTRRRLERALEEAARLDAERARAVTGRLERAREQLDRARGSGLEESLRAELEAAIAGGEEFASEVATLAARRDRLREEAQAALQELSTLERRAIMAAAKAEALERAQAVDDEVAAEEARSEEEIARRLELENELRDRLDDVARLSSRLTEIERTAAESREQKDRIESRLAEERRKRIELQLELEHLEDRHEKFIRERLALDESARTLKSRFDARTDRLYRSLVHNEGGLGETVAKSTRELMEANEELIRLQNDKASLLQQVERLRVQLRRAKGLPESAPVEEVDRATAAQERLSLALEQLRGQLDRRLDDLVQSFETRLAAVSPAPASPAVGATSILNPLRAAAFFAKESSEVGLVSSVGAALAPVRPELLAPPPTDTPVPTAELASVYEAAVKAIEEPLATPAAPEASELAAAPAPEAAREEPSVAVPGERELDLLGAPPAESTRHRLQRALEAGIGDEGELEALFQKQRRRLRGQDESTTPHGSPGAPSASPAADAEALERTVDLDRTPLPGANPGAQPEAALERAAAAGLSDALVRAKEALRERLAKHAGSSAADPDLERTMRDPPSLSDDEDEDLSGDEALRVAAFVRQLEEPGDPATPDTHPYPLDPRDTVDLGPPLAHDADKTTALGAVPRDDATVVLGAAPTPDPQAPHAQPPVHDDRSKKDASSPGLVLLDRAPTASGGVPTGAAGEVPEKRRRQVAPATSGVETRLFASGDGRPSDATIKLGPPTFVKVAGRSPEATPAPTPGDPSSTGIFANPLFAAPARAAGSRAASPRPWSDARAGRPRSSAVIVDEGPRVDLLRFALWLVLGALCLLAGALGWRAIRHRSAAPGPLVLDRADTLDLEPRTLDAWRAGLHAYAQALAKGAGEPVGASLAAFAADYQASESDAPLRMELDAAARASGFQPRVFWGVTRRIALADQRVTLARQRAVEQHWKEKEVRADALEACGPNQASRRDVDFYLAHETDVLASWAELVSASRDARARRAAAQDDAEQR